MRTAEQFQEQVKKKDIKKWNIHDCSICGYQCGYVFENGEALYDSGCYCVSYKNVEPRTWEDVAGQYNMQKNAEVIKKMDEFWGFDVSKELEG